LTQAVDSGGIIVSEVLANRLGVREGQSLEIMTPQGTRLPAVAVLRLCHRRWKLVMDRILYQSLWQDES
jgi:putative ABC transport system permease protein